MKAIFLGLLALISITCFSQRPLSVSVTAPISVSNTTLSVSVNNNREVNLTQATLTGTISTARLYEAPGNVSTTVTAGSTYGIGGLPTLQPAVGRKYLIRRIHVSTTLPCYVAINGGNGSAVTPPISATLNVLDSYTSTLYANFTQSTGGYQIIETPGLVISEGSKLGAIYVTLPAGATVKPDVQIMVEYYNLTYCYNTDADLPIILILGDSITNGSSVGTDPSGISYYGESTWWGRMNDYLDSTGHPCNIINKAVPGTTAVGTGYMVRYNQYLRSIPYSLLIVQIGTNDASKSNAQSQVEQYLTLIATESRKRRPKADILFIAPTPTDHSAYVTNIAAMRTAVSNVATAQNSTLGNVYFYNAGTAFTPSATATTDLNYTNAERVTNGRLHPSGAGHAYEWLGLKSVLSSTRFFLNL